jgi:plasmid stabilization system protein ParE
VTFHVVFRVRARVELLEARAWYDEQQPDLGKRFEAAVEGTIDQIAETPLAFPRVDGETRRAIVRRFPYNVFFRVSRQDVIILAVVHGHRSPLRWQARD